MPRYSYIVVEGIHDVAFIGRLLKSLGINLVSRKTRLDQYWYPLIPKSFPIDDDLLKRVPVPRFYSNAESGISVAVQQADGESRITELIQESMGVLGAGTLSSVGAFLDADNCELLSERFDKLCSKLDKVVSSMDLPDEPGIVLDGSPRFGVFVLPDNRSLGTLEDVLIECASQVYRDALDRAQHYVKESAGLPCFQDSDRQDYSRPAGHNKAVIASIGSILKPGKAIQTSIDDNRWMEWKAVHGTSLFSIQSFLRALLALD